ncbi:hypothetical protein PNEG_01486 [Pneumocystis murina B123]|uniref:Non-specific serine/threonine protein kinase n=1 Tax=Pneumocystis murina (strain B123) TaxID=1069680 RepID=M7PID0_PNEMU|nr:hypothetical protein PNEG_01486 [Pneumocystis murina B123]EMR10214.1 hypothetical protein PNEG_01486 [Pneumocystis murina B123]
MVQEVPIRIDQAVLWLSDPSTDIKNKIEAVNELLESLDALQLNDYQGFLSKLIPVMIQVLDEGEPSFNSLSHEQNFRISLLNLLHRLPLNETFRSYASDVMKVLMKLLHIDNEENAILSLKIIVDLHRSFKQNLEEYVQPFLDFVLEIFKNMPQVVKESFPSVSSELSSPSYVNIKSSIPMSSVNHSETENSGTSLGRSKYSFKVLTECPIIVVLLFQSHKQIIPTNLPSFISAIIEMLSLQAAPQEEEHLIAASKNEIFTGVSSNISNKILFGEFIIAQIKTMSFLAYVLRGFTAAMRKYQNKIPEFCVRILKDCPPEISSPRKELLVATRHILATDFRNAFIKKIDFLLDEKVLIGEGVTVHETLRPLAYSMLADLIHHVRSELSVKQISQTIRVYSANLHDWTLAISIQTMSAKLLLNMIDRIMKLPQQSEGRQLLIIILDNFAKKLEELNQIYPFLKHKQFISDAKLENMSQKYEPLDNIDINIENGLDLQRLSPIEASLSSFNLSPSPLKDGRVLFKNLIIGLKPILFGLKSCNPLSTCPLSNIQQWNDVVRGLDTFDVLLFTKIFHEGCKGFIYYKNETGKNNDIKSKDKPTFIDSSITINIPSTREEKDVIETFATIFIHIDPAVFQEIFQAQLPIFFEQVLKNPSLLHIPHFFLTNDNTSSGFVGILLLFLKSKLKEVGAESTPRTLLLLRFFKLAFMAVTMFPDSNEVIIRPHLSYFIIQSFKLSTAAAQPMNYFLLLRSLFRSIGGGRFELLYKEVLPLLQVILEYLNNLIQSSRKPSERDLFVELCLTVPVRLSVLLPYLNYLMRPLVLALRPGSDQVSQGLRTLELCIDNLTQDFLDPILAPVVDDLMAALWEHLKPLPYSHQHSHTTLRILGKLGGRNRKFIMGPKNLNYEWDLESHPRVSIYLHGSNKPQIFRPTVYIDLSVNTIRDPRADLSYKKYAYQHLSSIVKLFLNSTEIPPKFGELLRKQIKIIISEDPSFSAISVDDDKMDMDENTSSKRIFSNNTNITVHGELWKKALLGCFYAISIEQLKSDVNELISNICRHLTFLELQQTYEEIQIRSRAFSIQSFIDPIYLDVRIIGDVIVVGLSSEIEEVRNLSESCIQIFYNTLVTILGSDKLMDRIPLFHSFANKFCHACYKEHSYDKAGGVLGIKILIKILNKYINWITNHELDFIRALLFVLKDTSPEIPSTYVNNSVDTIMHILRLCNSDTSEIQLNNEKQRKFTALTALLITELSNPSTIVRETVKSAFRLLSELQGTELHELLKPVQERLLQPIFIKPLRALPFGMQFGHIDAITFCLSLEPSFLEFSDELIRLLHEALALADAEDEALVTASKASQYKNASALINLRIVCIKILSIAISFPEFSTPAQTQTRGRIISVFFKSLYSKSIEIVEVANKGLKQVLAQNHKLPKDQLQAGLRPILMNLSDHKRLTVAGLEGLARLLELLTSYFKVEIGKKLLDHLRVWADPSLLQMISGSPLEEQHCITIISAILNIFHLLPPSANTFLEELVTIVMDLEGQLRRTLSSPLRKPLLNFLNKYPIDCWNYFSLKLDQQKYSLFFSQILSADISDSLRAYVSSDLNSVILHSFLKDENCNNIWAIVSGVTIIKALISDNKFSIMSNNDLVQALLKVFSIPIIQSLANKGDEYYFQTKLIIQTLIKIFKFYISQFPNDFKVIFHCFEIASTCNLIGFNVFDELIFEKIVSNQDIQYKRNIIMLCLDIIADKHVTSYWKTYLFRKIINPILLMTYHKKEDLVDKLLIDTIHIKVWKLALNDFGIDLFFSTDTIKNEIIQMTATIIKYNISCLDNDIKKDIIKFAWNYIKLDDTITKYSAYVLLTYSVSFYETSKIIIQIYMALLKSSNSEGRHLVKQALNILAPVLSACISSSDIRYPDWVKWLKCIIMEENNNIPLLVNAFQFIMHHETLFYQYREFFIPQMVTVLPKLGFTQNANIETRILTIELIELIAKWEERRLQSSLNNNVSDSNIKLEEQFHTDDKSTEMKAEESTKISNRDYIPPMILQDAIITYLARVACSSPESYSRKGVSSKAIPLIRQLINPHYWRDVTIKLSFFEKILKQTEISKKTIGQYSNVLEILSIVIEFQSDQWISENIQQFQDLLEKAIKLDNEEIHKILKPILIRIFANLSDNKENSSGLDFKMFIINIIQDNLQNSVNLISTISLLSCIPADRSDILDPFIPSLIKVFQKIVKDHLSLPVQQNRTLSQANLDNNYNANNSVNIDPETMVKLIEGFIGIIKKKAMHLGDQRRLFLAAFAQLIEKSPSSRLCFTILEVLKEWVIEQQVSFPTIKEKAALLLKMISFETRGDSVLYNKFLSLIVTIYENPAITRTELTVRLEQAFMIGTKAEDISIRNHFMDIFNKSMSKNVYTRLNYILGVQKWESLAGSFWISQANQLLIESVVMKERISILETDYAFRTLVSDKLLSLLADDETFMMDTEIDALILNHKTFLHSIDKLTAESIILPLSHLQFLELNMGSQLWSDIFSMSWNSIGKRDRHELSKLIVALLANNYHTQQMDKRPNVIKTILQGLARNASTIKFPPHLIKYLGKTFNAWYEALELLEEISAQGSKNTPALRESTLDALAEMYATLQEDDMFYGLWRRRCQYLETNAAISYEQIGMWDRAQHMYENAQIKARTGVLPFSESEYTLWEDHWLLCAQKLQQWDILTDLAKQESYSDLLLECAWRVTDWTTNREALETSIKSLMDIPTPRRYIFEAFTILQKTQAKLESIQEFIRVCDEGIQLSLRKWYQLPVIVSNSHIPLLQNFQQYVELHEASQIYASLSSTNAQNLEAKSQELKNILGTWRERLPNMWDDINTWSDLVAWRQLIFSSINKEYMSLVPCLQQQAGTSGNNSSTTSFAYRGYHETAWIINRFAHVSRKHQLAEVCINQLTKIYTLPNIEIQEAFLKLREQAKCHYQNHNELSMGLEVISNTNLMYFGQQQKAEFFTLKGMFLAKLKMNDDANQAFATAVQIDLTLSKAWAKWGQYNDRLFKENPWEITAASNAVSCYLQAAGLLKNGKARKVLSRVLWLLSLDDSSGTISKAFDSYKGDISVWNWIIFIPQLLTSLSHKEARHARQILVRIAKTYPQALYFQLRTTKEDYTIIKKQALAAAQSASKNNSILHDQLSSSIKTGNLQNHPKSNISESDAKQNPQIPFVNAKTENNQPSSNNAIPNLQQVSNFPQNQHVQSQFQNCQPWEHVDEIMSILKTAYPLLALSMETMVDQIQQRFKCTPDEDAYRLIVALLNDGIQYIGRLTTVTSETKLPPVTQANITRFAESVLPKNIKIAFENEFIKEKLNLHDYITRLRKWRDNFESILDRRPKYQPLEQCSPYLSEFQYQKFDEVEVPGQYLQHKENNNDFARIDRFMTTLDVIRGHGICYKRLTIRGYDGSIYPFAVQYPAARHCRREERIMQLFRILSGVLLRKKETRRRNITFTLPIAVPIAPHIRIVEDDPSGISLQGIYEEYCRRYDMHKDEPLKYFASKLNSFGSQTFDKQDIINLKIEILTSIQTNLVPDDILLKYFKQLFSTYCDFWRFRKQFTLQYAGIAFMTYIMNINNRFPNKLYISRSSGNVWGTEFLPAMASNNPVFHNGEAVPFRFTPNIQTFITPIGIEGIFSSALMAIARSLTEPEFGLDQYLSIFVRDELITWFTQQHRPLIQDSQLREKVAGNVDLVVRRVASLSQVAQGNLPANQTIIDLVSQAVNPRALAQMDQLWAAWL